MKKYQCLLDWHENATRGEIYPEDHVLSGSGWTVADDVKNAPQFWILQKEESSDKGNRYNDNKPKFSLIDLNSMQECAKVLEFGAKKYSRDNWKKGLVMTEILDSMLRHIAALQNGEWNDPESGLSHIGHIQCNALFLGCKNNIIDLDFK